MDFQKGKKQKILFLKSPPVLYGCGRLANGSPNTNWFLYGVRSMAILRPYRNTVQIISAYLHARNRTF
jgi:hypothetical protein